jgi:hypothetical protein
VKDAIVADVDFLQGRVHCSRSCCHPLLQVPAFARFATSTTVIVTRTTVIVTRTTMTNNTAVAGGTNNTAVAFISNVRFSCGQHCQFAAYNRFAQRPPSFYAAFPKATHIKHAQPRVGGDGLPKATKHNCSSTPCTPSTPSKPNMLFLCSC